MTTMTSRAAGGISRFETPLYTVSEAARYLDVSPTTMRNWARGYPSRSPGTRQGRELKPVITALASRGRREPVLPFVGLAEGMVLTAIRRSGVSLQRIRPALDRLTKDLGMVHALASKRLYTDGAEILFDYAVHEASDAAQAARELVVVRTDQRVFNDVVSAYLRRIEFDSDGYARLIHLPAYHLADVVVDPERGFGQPIFARGGVRIEDALSLFAAGEPLGVVAEEYGMPEAELEDVLRTALRRPA